MTNISKKKLDSKIERQLFTQFVGLFTNEKEKRLSSIIQTLFTDTEKVMFMKRLAIVYMIAQGHSTYAIAKNLNVSDATVRATKQKFDAGSYDEIGAIAQKKTLKNDEFWKTLDLLLRAGLPPRAGRGRWKWLYKMTEENYKK